MMTMLMCAVSGILLSAPADMAPVPVILDTDLGDDIDDTWALAMLLGCPQVDLKLVVTATNDTEKKTRLVAKILEKTGRTGVPLGTGIKNGDRPLNQEKWLGAYTLDAYPGTVHEDGVQAMIDLVNASADMMTILVIGPQTNLKAALERDPGIAKKARVVSMAGSVAIGYGGKPGRCPEYNVKRDVEAAQAVFAAPWEIVMAPLDSCGTLILKGERFAKVAASKNALSAVVIDNYRQWSNFHRYPEGESSVLFDTVAAYLAFDQSLCEMKTVKLSVDGKGNTAPDEDGRPVHCAMGWKDRDAFEDLLVESITGK